MFTYRNSIAAAALVLTLAATPMSAQMSQAKHIRGTVASASSSSLTIATASGKVTVELTSQTRVTGVAPASVSDIKPGTFIGSANVQTNQSGVAQEVVVFPDSMRGAGEGNYAWDLPAGAGTHGHSMMSNGTVSAAPMQGHSMMSNGTVSGVGGNMYTVAYKGGSVKITVPPGTPIVKIVAASAAQLVPGAHVFVVTAPGANAASRVIVGISGAVPPM